MTFHTKLPDRCCEIITNFRLFSIVSHTHTDMITAGITPDVIGHFKSIENKMDLERQLELMSYRMMRIPRSSFRARFTKSMNTLISIERRMFSPVEIWWIIFVLTFSFTLNIKINHIINSKPTRHTILGYRPVQRRNECCQCERKN